MLGAIIGDIAGSLYEFDPTNDYHFEAFAAGSGFTDDTICTVAVADAILRGEDYGEAIHRWCRRYPCPMGGYGGRFAAWVHSDTPKPYGSFGNGSAMRVSPVAWAFDDEKSVLTHAARTAECTHNHLEGIKGAQTVALAIFKARSLRRSDGTLGAKEKGELLVTCAAFAGYDLRIRRAAVENRFDETCQGTVPVALWIIGQSSSFEDAVRRAVSLGADADTLGAIVGSIAEAIWKIPATWRDEAWRRLPAEMQEVIAQFRTRYMI